VGRSGKAGGTEKRETEGSGRDGKRMKRREGQWQI